MDYLLKIKDCFAYHRKFSAIQKIILLFIILGVPSTFSYKILLILVFYILAITTTIIVCHSLISSSHNYTFILRLYIFYSSHKHVFDHVFKLKEFFKSVINQSENVDDEFYDAHENETRTENDHLKNESYTHSTKSTTKNREEEVEKITKLIQKHFVHTWLKDFEPNVDVISEFDKILEKGIKDLALTFKSIECHKLVGEILLHGKEHLKTLQTSRDKYKTQPKRRSSLSRRDSMRKFASVEEAFLFHSTYHIALYEQENEIHYIYSVCDILLSQTFGNSLKSSQIVKLILSEILTFNVFLPIVDFLAEPDFIYEKLVLILSDELLQSPEDDDDEEDSFDQVNKQFASEPAVKEKEQVFQSHNAEFEEFLNCTNTSQSNEESSTQNYQNLPENTYKAQHSFQIPLTLLEPSTPIPPTNQKLHIDSSKSIVENQQENVASKETKADFFLSFNEDEQEEMYSNSTVVIESHPLIFQDITIADYEIMKESRSTSQFVLYTIQYHAFYWVAGNKEPVLRTREAKRRHREFINLHGRLEDNSDYKGSLKDVKGPKRWQTLPFGNLNKKSIEDRQKSLDAYLKSVIQKEDICNGPELKEFLAYEGDGHIAFVRKTPEMGVPRIDKMIVKTMSGVFDELIKIPSRVNFPSLPGRKEINKEDKEDCDQITLDFDLDSKCESQEETLEGFVKICDTPSCKVEESSERRICKQTESKAVDNISLAEAALDFGVQTLQGKDNWACRERVISVTKHLIGVVLDRWLRDQIDSLTSEEMCTKYLRLLRETVWPDGELFEGGRAVKTDRQKSHTKEQARRVLTQFFPDTLRQVIGEEDFDHGINEIIESLQYKKLNRHLIYTLLDLSLETLYPEIQNMTSTN